MPSRRISLDKIDMAILNALQEDSSVANAELASRVGLSASACLSRTKRLRETGFIRQYVAVVDEERVGLGITAFTFIALARHDRKAAESFLRRVHETPPVMECWHVTGQADYLLKIVAPDIASYRDFLMDTLVRTPDVRHIETLIVLKAEKRSYRLPIGRSAGKSK